MKHECFCPWSFQKSMCTGDSECGRDCSPPLHIFNGCTSFHHYTWWRVAIVSQLFSFSFPSFDLLTNIENMTSLLFLTIALCDDLNKTMETFMTRGRLFKGLQKRIWELGRDHLCSLPMYTLLGEEFMTQEFIARDIPGTLWSLMMM